VAQLGRAPGSGPGGRGFKSHQPDVCYLLRSQKTGRRYVGSRENVTEHTRRHNAGDSKATKHGVPWVLVHSEGFGTRAEAAQRERYYRPAGVEMSSRGNYRAVAAATGRGFKSHQPDVNYHIPLDSSDRLPFLRSSRKEPNPLVPLHSR
jgi:putative endonuclease